MNFCRQHFALMFSSIYGKFLFIGTQTYQSHYGCSMLTYQQSPELLSFLCTAFTTIGLSVAHNGYDRFLAIVYLYLTLKTLLFNPICAPVYYRKKLEDYDRVRRIIG